MITAKLRLKRNKMMFGQKSENAVFNNDGKIVFEGIFNDAKSAGF